MNRPLPIPWQPYFRQAATEAAAWLHKFRTMNGEPEPARASVTVLRDFKLRKRKG